MEERGGRVGHRHLSGNLYTWDVLSRRLGHPCLSVGVYRGEFENVYTWGGYRGASAMLCLSLEFKNLKSS
jgi:hypothetical protein